MAWLCCAMGEFTTTLGSAFADAGLAGPIAADLQDEEILNALACAAKAVYLSPILAQDSKQQQTGPDELSSWLQRGGLLLEDKGVMSERLDGDTCVTWALYKIQATGASILAFQGTVDFKTLVQDVSMIISGSQICKAAREAAALAVAKEPDYLTGHSLGGFLAECACSHTGIEGASFGAPGPVGLSSAFGEADSLLGNKFGGVRWKTVINRGDIIARTIGGVGGSQSSHIVKSANIAWVDFNGGALNPLLKHDMASYADEGLKQIGQINQESR